MRINKQNVPMKYVVQRIVLNREGLIWEMCRMPLRLATYFPGNQI
jgi:hypothetical protein